MKKTALLLTMILNLCVLLGQTQYIDGIPYIPGTHVHTCKDIAIPTLVAQRELTAQELAQTNYVYLDP